MTRRKIYCLCCSNKKLNCRKKSEKSTANLLKELEELKNSAINDWKISLPKHRVRLEASSRLTKILIETMDSGNKNLLEKF